MRNDIDRPVRRPGLGTIVLAFCHGELVLLRQGFMTSLALSAGFLEPELHLPALARPEAEAIPTPPDLRLVSLREEDERA